MNAPIVVEREKCLVRIVPAQVKSESWTLLRVNILSKPAKNAVAQGQPTVIFVRARGQQIARHAKGREMLHVKNVMERKSWFVKHVMERGKFK